MTAQEKYMKTLIKINTQNYIEKLYLQIESIKSTIIKLENNEIEVYKQENDCIVLIRPENNYENFK